LKISKITEVNLVIPYFLEKMLFYIYFIYINIIRIKVILELIVVTMEMRHLCMCFLGLKGEERILLFKTTQGRTRILNYLGYIFAQ
jgi:hypothetical protein